MGQRAPNHSGSERARCHVHPTTDLPTMPCWRPQIDMQVPVAFRSNLGNSHPGNIVSMKNILQIPNKRQEEVKRTAMGEKRVLIPESSLPLRNGSNAINPFTEGSELRGHTRHRQADKCPLSFGQQHFKKSCNSPSSS